MDVPWVLFVVYLKMSLPEFISILTACLMLNFYRARPDTAPTPHFQIPSGSFIWMSTLKPVYPKLNIPPILLSHFPYYINSFSDLTLLLNVITIKLSVLFDSSLTPQFISNKQPHTHWCFHGLECIIEMITDNSFVFKRWVQHLLVI